MWDSCRVNDTNVENHPLANMVMFSLIESGKMASLSLKMDRLVSSLGDTFNGPSEFCYTLLNLHCQV
jgi:hypothetical protein